MHINMSQLSLTEFARNSHTLIVTPDQSLKDIMKPTAWAHTAKKISPRDRIEVIAEDHSWMAELFVLSTSNLWVKTRILKEWKFEIETKDSDSIYEVKWRGPHSKWAVIFKTDNSVMQDGFDDQEAAKKYRKLLTA